MKYALFSIGLFVALSNSGCSWLTPSHVVDVAQIAACVLQHDQDPIETIGIECAIQDQQQIRDILSAHKAASKREAQRWCQ